MMCEWLDIYLAPTDGTPVFAIVEYDFMGDTAEVPAAITFDEPTNSWLDTISGATVNPIKFIYIPE